MEFVTYKNQHECGYITLNRPKQYNALNSQLLSDFSAVLDQAEKDQVHCLIITGSGEKAFAAGADIAEMVEMSPVEARVYATKGNQVMTRLETFPVPVIAAINGFALGGGCEIALASDIRIASENAVFGMPETGLGIIPGFGGTQRLTRIIGQSLANELVFTGKKLKANEALEAHLINRIVPMAELIPEAEKIAANICKNGPYAIQMAKRAMSTNLVTQADINTEIDCFSSCFATDDQKEAMRAFLQNK